MEYDNIPEELRKLNQWVVWRGETINNRLTKIPYSPILHTKAKVDDPSTWCSYDQAVNAVKENSGFHGIGFVLTSDDPYCFIDLDDPADDQDTVNLQQQIYTEFDSYSELSPSGKGLHIICRGAVPNGKRKQKVEIYSSLRYMTMTGQVFNDKPILDRSSLVDELWQQMSGVPTENGAVHDAAMVLDDDRILSIALNADNGEKFDKLWKGDWYHDYESQSEADQALMNILQFYTKNHEQLKRLFRNSGLGKRDKAKRNDYIEGMIIKSFDNEVPEIDLEAYQNSFSVNGTENIGKSPVSDGIEDCMIEVPPGMVGELAKYIYAVSVRPVPEVSIVAALAIMSGICGRSYNVSGTGLNMYYLFIGKTGIGKSGVGSGISNIIKALKLDCPSISDYLEGPAEFSSGKALINSFAKRKCYVSVFGEIGIRFAEMRGPRAPAHLQSLKRVMLDIFAKSGHGQLLMGSKYADAAKDMESILSPSLSMIGEGTPKTFYDALDDAVILDGLLPRFLTIDYAGKRPYMNESHNSVGMPTELQKWLKVIVMNATNCDSINNVYNVAFTDEAKQWSRQYGRDCDDMINNSEDDVLRELWNRAHLKILKVAGLLAVGKNPYNPTIDMECLLWAQKLVELDIKNLYSRFERGDVGEERHVSVSVQIEDMYGAIKRYVGGGEEICHKYKVPPDLKKACVVPYTYISRTLICRAAFKNHRLGATPAIKHTLKELIDRGDIAELSSAVAMKTYGYRGKCYVILNKDIIK